MGKRGFPMGQKDGVMGKNAWSGKIKRKLANQAVL